MGCPHSQYDGDDPVRKTPSGARDWADVSVVSNEMADTWSGYVAYAYDGPSDFDMMSGGPWNGVDVLAPTTDMYNFKMRLNEDVAMTPRGGGGPTTKTNDVAAHGIVRTPPPRRCDEVEAELLSCCDVRLFDDDDMASFRYDEGADLRLSHRARWYAAAAMAAFALCWIVRRGPWRTGAARGERGGPHHQNGDGGGTKYGTIALS